MAKKKFNLDDSTDKSAENIFTSNLFKTARNVTGREEETNTEEINPGKKELAGYIINKTMTELLSLLKTKEIDDGEFAILTYILYNYKTSSGYGIRPIAQEVNMGINTTAEKIRSLQEKELLKRDAAQRANINQRYLENIIKEVWKKDEKLKEKEFEEIHNVVFETDYTKII